MGSSIIYSKIEYPIAIQAKRDLLESEANLLRALKNIKNYRTLRKRELMYKIKLKKTVKETQDLVKHILKEIPKIPHSEIDNFNEEERTTKKEKTSTSTIESELAEIQRRLQELA